MKSMVRVMLFSAVLTVGALLTSCGTPFPLGCLYTDIYMPVTAGNADMQYNRIGRAEVNNFLGWVATGDAGIDTACHNGQIKQVSWVTQHITNFFGIYGTYETIVYGIGDKADPSVAPENMMK